jgi:hypothetical protein
VAEAQMLVTKKLSYNSAQIFGGGERKGEKLTIISMPRHYFLPKLTFSTYLHKL